MKMHPTQKAYYKAKAAYEALREANDAAIDTAVAGGALDLLECEQIMLWNAIEAEFPANAAYKVLKAAEDAMLEWCHEMMKTDKRYAATRETMETVFTACDLNLSIRWKAVDLAARLIA